MDSTMFLAELIGLSFVIVTLAMLSDKKKVIQAIKTMLADDGMLFVLEVLSTVVGLAVVLSHNFWSDAASIIIALFGWIFLIRGIIGLFMTDLSLRKLYHLVHFEEYYYLFITILLIVGIYLTYAALHV